MKETVGAMTEELVVQTSAPAALAVTSIVRVDAVATVTTTANHGYLTGDRVTIAGADQAAYNGTVAITVTGLKTFTYAVAGAPATPATGTITATYVSDPARGERETWRTLATIWGEIIPQRTSERLQAGVMVGESFVQFRIYYRDDLSVKDRVVWNTTRTLEIRGITSRDRQWTILDCLEVVA